MLFSITATVKMRPATTVPNPLPMVEGWGPVVLFDGRLFYAKLTACASPIQPGEVGEATIGIIASSPHSLGIQKGSLFELRDGLNNLRAIAEASAVEAIAT
jgi:hypothetical protein